MTTTNKNITDNPTAMQFWFILHASASSACVVDGQREENKTYIEELAKDKKILNEAKGETKDDTEEKLIKKIKKEMEGENRPSSIKDFVTKLLKIYEAQIKVEKKEQNEEQILEIQEKIERLKNEDYWWNDE